jgi:hypothetical protein
VDDTSAQRAARGAQRAARGSSAFARAVGKRYAGVSALKLVSHISALPDKV